MTNELIPGPQKVLLPSCCIIRITSKAFRNVFQVNVESNATSIVTRRTLHRDQQPTDFILHYIKGFTQSTLQLLLGAKKPQNGFDTRHS